MLEEDIRKHSGYQAYAQLMQRKCNKDEAVDVCVADDFNGDWSEFVHYANSFIENAYGVVG